MKAFILRSGTRILPFDDPPDKARVLNETVEKRRGDLLRRLKLEPETVDSLEAIRESEYLLLYDYAYASLGCLKAFLRAVLAHRQSRRLALASNAQIELSLPMQELAPLPAPDGSDAEHFGFDIYYVNEAGMRAERLQELPPEIVPVKMRVQEVDPPFYVRVKEKIRIGLSRSYCMHLKHWSHIYLLNFNALTALPFEWFPRKLLWFLWRSLTAFSFRPEKILRRWVIKGKRCSIHSTAVVEASVLGDDVSVGAHAVVRGCYLGNGVRVSEGARVMGSIVGDQTELAWNSILSMCVIYPRSCVGMPGLQTAVAGEDTFVSSMVLPLDVKFKGGYISVRHKGQTVTTRLTTLGPCFGHRVRIGAGVILNSGRSIPNDVDILPDPGPMLSRVPEDLAPGAYVVRNGSLVAMGSLTASTDKRGEGG